MRFFWLGLLVLVVPGTARAELLGCSLHGAAGSFAYECDGLVQCAVGESCPDGSPCDPLTLVCLPECSTIIGCEDDEDCSSLRAASSCQLFSAGAPFEGGGICTASDLPVQYCNGMGPLAPDRLLDCHTLPFSDTLTPSWFDGDCDRDGCPNASDGLPCVSGGACTRPSPILPVCPRRLVDVGPERCVFPSDVPSCATAHTCSTNEDCPLGFACEDETCEPIECTALYSCRSVADCPRDTELGTPILCLPSVLLDPGLGRGDGFCLFDSFDVTTACADLGEARSCFFRDGVFSNDFFQGDCDLDGCPNGLDPAPCAADSSEGCRSEGVSPACDTPIPPARDAGVPFEDAASPDGGAVPFDASPFDASVDDPVTFGGGGGCVCRAGPRSHHGILLSLLSACAVVLGLIRRRV
jgi:hypothetical protein